MIDTILSAVAKVLEIPTQEILRPNRHRLFVIARSIVITQLRKRGCAWQQISSVFNIHHSTAIHHYKKYQDEYDYNLLFRFLVIQVSNCLSNNEYQKLSDLSNYILEVLNLNKYFKQQSGYIKSAFAYTIFSRCGYSHKIFPKIFLPLNMLTVVDEVFITQIFKQITEFVDAQRLPERVG